MESDMCMKRIRTQTRNAWTRPRMVVDAALVRMKTIWSVRKCNVVRARRRGHKMHGEIASRVRPEWLEQDMEGMWAENGKCLNRCMDSIKCIGVTNVVGSDCGTPTQVDYPAHRNECSRTQYVHVLDHAHSKRADRCFHYPTCECSGYAAADTSGKRGQPC